MSRLFKDILLEDLPEDERSPVPSVNEFIVNCFNYYNVGRVPNSESDYDKWYMKRFLDDARAAPLSTQHRMKESITVTWLIGAVDQDRIWFTVMILC